MTNEEAKHILNWMYISEYDERKCQAITLGEMALEKQIPKKVGHRKLRKTEWGSPWYCSVCEAELIKVEFMSLDGDEPKEKVSYCWHCGSALDWSEEE